MDHAALATGVLDGLSWASAPRLSPDGSHVAFVVSTIDLDQNRLVRRIWLDAAPLTAGPHDHEPVWSPDGRHLAFTSKRAERERDTTLHVLPVDGPGEVRTVCSMPDGIAALAWSPDGRRLAFTSRTRDARYDAVDASWQPPRRIDRFFSRLDGEGWIFDRPSHVYVVAADGTGRATNLTPGEFQHRGISWLADSSGVVTAAARHETWDVDLAVDLHRVGTDGAIHPLTNRTGIYGLASVSPDGSYVAFVGVDDPLVAPQNGAVGVVSVDGGPHRWISRGLDRNFRPLGSLQPPVWSDDTTVLALAEDRGEQHLFRCHLDGRPPQRVTSGAIMVHGFDAANRAVAIARSSVDRPAEIHLSRAAQDPSPSSSTPGGFTCSGFTPTVPATAVGWERFEVACADGTDHIDAWIMRPVRCSEDECYPVLLNVHGGPFAQYGETFFDEAQMQAAAGFVAVLSNPRGSSGRDTGWGQAINGPRHPVAPGSGWGSVDVDDVIAVLDEALGRFSFCDPDRVGMLGGSYGGYLATLLAARHGHRFRAICSERAVNNLLTEEWSSDISTYFRSSHGVDPVSDPDEYLRMSPSRLARDIHVPMLIVHADDDLRCPINQAEELWTTLRMLGRDVTFYRFPGEHHDLSRTGSPVHRRMRAEIILDFFREHLRPEQ